MSIQRDHVPRGVRLSIAWGAAVVLLVVGLVLAARSEAVYRHQAAGEARVQADILAASVTAALAFDDREAIREYVGALRVNGRVAAAAVYDLQGRSVVAFAPADVPPPPARLPKTPGGDAMTVIRPVSQGGVPLGSVYLAMRPEPLSRVFARHSGLGLLMIMAFLLQGVMTRAAYQLRRRAGELSQANERLTVEIEERAKAEEALRQSQKMEALGQLTGGIAHDFNNLLQVVQGSFDLIRRKSDDREKVRAWAEGGLQAAERGASLTRQLLTFSRAQKLDLKPVPLAAMIRDMHDLVSRTMGPTFEIDIRLDDTDGRVLADRTQLELAVLNMAINARDAMGEGGRLVIATRAVRIGPGHPVLPADDYLDLSVSDTGPGMARQVAERAFEPFFTTKGVGKGTGLGLSQVYGVARQAGGDAYIESEPGAGARVVLLLRRADADPVATTPAAGGPEGERGGPLKVLLVDDDLEVRRVAAAGLELMGHTVRVAESGPEALEMLERERPDLMLLDFAMPGMTGAEAAVLARRRWPDLPIVFASGYADTDAVDRAVGPGAVILYKPFQMDQLSRVIDQAARRTG